MTAIDPSEHARPPISAAETARTARIAVLPELVKNQIAAGEVIERPASVVKELVENALDAGATRIQVDLEEGGAKLVRVRDDGSGMAREDLELAFVPHATSKLFAVEDLDHIASLGFRGEALASMGAVARCSILSRERDAPIGWRIADDGGRIEGPVEAGGPFGTTVEVRELFFNVPARRRFLKRAATELARVLDVVQRLALAHEGVAFAVTHDGGRAFDVDAAMDLCARVRRAFGAELADTLVAVDARDGDVRLSGYVAPPRLARADTQRQMWFLNGRMLRDKVLVRALSEGYRGFLFERRQPVAFLRLAMDPARVDVNVHPAKSEVRFRDEHRLFGFIVTSVRGALARADLAMPAADLLRVAARRDVEHAARQAWILDEPRRDDATTSALHGAGAVRESPSPRHATDSDRAESARTRDLSPRDPAREDFLGARIRDSSPERVRDSSPERERDSSPERERDLSPERARDSSVRTPSDDGAPARIAGGDDLRGPFLQIACTYLVRTLEDGFEIIDQHALHERVTYEALVAEMRASRVAAQRYLVPELVEVSRDEAQALADHFELLGRIGIELAVFGPTTIAVHALPARLDRPDPAAIVREVLSAIGEARAPASEDLLEAVLHRAACRSSVMAGDELDPEEIRALIERGAGLESDQTCVHGRPTRVRFTLADLERVFHRR